MKGVKVIHKLLGEGSVVSLNNDMLTVQFTEKEMTFIFPDCFQNVLSTEDKDMSAFVKMAINNRALEKKLLEKKGLKRRVYETRKEVPRWNTATKSKQSVAKKEPISKVNSVKENRTSINRTIPKPTERQFNSIPRKVPTKSLERKPIKKNDFNKYSKNLVRYKGINCFLYLGEIKNDTIVVNPIELKDNKELCQYVYKNDLVFSVKENKVQGIGIVSTTKLTDEQTYKFTLNIIPMLEEIKVKNEYTSVINHLTPMEYRDLLYGIRKFCPYISSIEGIRELMWPKQENETLFFFPSKNYKFELYKNDIALLYNMYKFSVFIVKTVEKF